MLKQSHGEVSWKHSFTQQICGASVVRLVLVVGTQDTGESKVGEHPCIVVLSKTLHWKFVSSIVCNYLFDGYR